MNWLRGYKNVIPFVCRVAGLFIIPCSFAHAQTPTREQLAGTWIGVRLEYDNNFTGLIRFR